MSYNPTISLPTEQFYFFSPDSSTPWRTCCEDCHALHDILLLRTSAIRRRLYLGRRLDSHQDEFVLLATYRGGSLISFQDKIDFVIMLRFFVQNGIQYLIPAFSPTVLSLHNTILPTLEQNPQTMLLSAMRYAT